MEVTEVTVLAEAPVHGEEEEDSLLIGTTHIRSSHFLIFGPRQVKLLPEEGPWEGLGIHGTPL